METLNRLDLTEYETERLHLTARVIKENSFAVGAFVTRYGSEENLKKAGHLFLCLLEELATARNLRTGAIGYGLAMAEFRAKDWNVSQATRLQAEFTCLLYSAIIAERE
jgi:hypothetical protein